MKLQLASLLALSASAAHIRSRRGVSGTGCPIDWIEADGPDNCLPDGDDFSVTCNTDSMTISFNLNHLYEDGQAIGNQTLFTQQNSVLGTIGPNSDPSCLEIDAGMWGGNRITVGLMYGNCMDVGQDGDEMTFTTKIAGDSQIASHSDNNSSVSIHTGRVLEFEVECRVQSNFDVELQTYVATRSFSGGEVNSTHSNHNSTALSDISFTMTAMLEAMPSVTIDQNQPVNIGMPIIIQVESSTAIADENGFRWYIESCTAAKDGRSYDIIKVSFNFE